jgi:hypothetical protein
MAPTSPQVLEMPPDPAAGTMPTYPLLLDWTRAEVAGLNDTQLDFHDPHPEREWMWWSIRRQVSHLAWDALVFSRRRCHALLWPDGDIPAPIDWDAHRLGPRARWDRVLDETRHRDLPSLLDMLALGIGWLAEVVETQSIETLRATSETIHGTPFWAYVITTLPRGAALVEDPPGHIRYTLEGSLWMVFYEQLAHIRTIQRLKAAQGLGERVALPRVGYLRLPEYWGDRETNGPGMERL